MRKNIKPGFFPSAHPFLRPEPNFTQPQARSHTTSTSTALPLTTVPPAMSNVYRPFAFNAASSATAVTFIFRFQKKDIHSLIAFPSVDNIPEKYGTAECSHDSSYSEWPRSFVTYTPSSKLPSSPDYLPTYLPKKNSTLIPSQPSPSMYVCMTVGETFICFASHHKRAYLDPIHPLS